MRTLVFFIEFLIVVGIAIWLFGQPGAITIDWAGYHLEIQLSVAFLGLVALFLLTSFLIFIWRAIVLFPSRLIERSKRLQPAKGLKSLTQAVTHMILEEYDQAHQKTKKLQKYLGESSVQKGLEAEIYFKGKKYDEAIAACESIDEEEGHTLSWTLQAKIAMERGKEQEAIVVEHLSKLLKEHASSPWILRNLIKYCVQVDMLETALLAIKKAEKIKLYPNNVANRCHGFILFQKSKKSDNTLEEKEKLLEDAYRLASDIPQIVVQYAKVLRAKDKDRKARKVLEQGWAAHPHQDIFEAYVTNTEPKEALAAVDRLLSFNSSQLTSYLVIADYALSHQLWGRARAALQDAQKEYGLSQDLCQKFAQLERLERGDQTAYREWMERALSSPRLQKHAITIESILG